MHGKLLLTLTLAALAAPLSAATVTLDGVLVAGYPLPGPPSGVAIQISDNYQVAAAPGDTITAALQWPALTFENDLDLVLLLPSAAPVPLDTTDPVATAVNTASSRIARLTCADMAARSTSHAGSSEAITFTVPAGGESGTYTLAVRGWVLLSDQYYTLAVDAPGAIVEPTANQAFITMAPHCQQ